MLKSRRVVFLGEKCDKFSRLGPISFYETHEIESQLRKKSEVCRGYLKHIVENYESLEDLILFVHEDYESFVKLKPFKMIQEALSAIDFGFSESMGNISESTQNFRGFRVESEGSTLGDWWESTTGEPWIRSRRVFGGSLFALSKNQILKRKREDYSRILDSIILDSDLWAGAFCEQAWFNIFNLPFGSSTNFTADVHHAVRHKIDGFDLDVLLHAHKKHKSSMSRKPSSGKILVKFRHKNDMSAEQEFLSREELLGALDHVGDLMFKDEKTVRRVTNAFRQNIEGWIKSKCSIRPLKKNFISKEDLNIKSKWYVHEMTNESMEVSTSGSTTGFRFKYMRWHPAFNKIEWDYHHNLVLDEFGVSSNPHILYFFSDHYKKDGDKKIACFGSNSELALHNHGSNRNPVVHYANFDLYREDNESFFSHLFEYVIRNPIDVLFTSAPQIRSMCNYIRKMKIGHRIGFLLSNTGERMFKSDWDFLAVDNKYFEFVCDHMRCWDGGASFHTCRHGRYHLMDNISWVESEDNRMICTDYFNLSSPFVRYWNGDYCRVGDEYKRCECGRLFREFEFLESRPFSLKGVSMKEIKEGISSLKIDCIKEVRCSTKFLDVVSCNTICDEDKARVCSLTDRFNFRFLVEDS